MDTDSIMDKNPPSEDGMTPLHLAAGNGHTETFCTIMDRTEDKNPPSGAGWTPLHKAAYNGHTEVCRAILDVVEDKAPLTNIGATPLQLATTAEVRNLILSYLWTSILIEFENIVRIISTFYMQRSQIWRL